MLTVTDSEAPTSTSTELNLIEAKIKVYDTYNFQGLCLGEQGQCHNLVS